MHRISTAVVGAGFIGPVHVEALRRLGVRITGILGCDEAESQRAQHALGLPRAYANFDQVLSDNSVQVVHLAVPNVLHYEMSKNALEAGKHVMCEKPLAMNSNELWCGYRNEPNRSLLRDPGLVGDLARGFTNYPGGHNEGFPDAFKQCFRSFYQEIASGSTNEPLYATFEQGHQEVVLCEAILASHRQQSWVEVRQE